MAPGRFWPFPLSTLYSLPSILACGQNGASGTPVKLFMMAIRNFMLKSRLDRLFSRVSDDGDYSQPFFG
jgi:hypothetical protein